MFDLFQIYEASISILALILTFINYFISLRLKNIETRLSKLEEFENFSKHNFSLLHKISGQVDILVKDKK